MSRGVCSTHSIYNILTIILFHQYPMSSYKSPSSKAELYELLSNYEKRIHKKVEQIANKVINLSNIGGLYKEDQRKYNTTNPEREKHLRSNSTVDTNTKNYSFISKNKMLASIQQKLYQGGHLPKIKAEKVKQKQIDKLNKSKGKIKYGRPRFTHKQPHILPKQIRNNPFSQPRPVPVSELKNGLLNLMNKGVINKDVDISVAFQWGEAPFKSKGAVIHSYDEIVIHQQEEDKNPLRNQRKQEAMVSFPSSIKNLSPNPKQKQDQWALTGIDSSIITIKKKNSQLSKEQKPLFSEVIHIEFKNYILKCQSKQFVEFKKRNIPIWGQIIQLLMSIQNYIQKYSMTLVFVDGRKVAHQALSLHKVTDKQISQCIVGTSFERSKIQSLKRISNGILKQKIAAQTIIKILKFNVVRKKYRKILYIKSCISRISNWVYGSLQRKKTRVKIAQNIKMRNKRIEKIQHQFQLNYENTVSAKHYEIHIPSTLINNNVDFPEKLNTEICRIFHLSPNINIIYVSPIQMTQETINYYYKIMELGEVENYKQRLKFINYQTNKYYHAESLSKRLYYSSKAQRQIKKIIKGSRAILVGGQAEEATWFLVDSLAVPSITNFRDYQLTKRSSPLGLFRTLDVPYLPFWKIQPTPIGEFYLNELARRLTNFASDNKLKTICVRFNSEHSSFVTVKCPVKNYEDLLQKTTLYDSSQFANPNFYFRHLLKTGGVAEKHEQSRYLRSLVHITPNKKVNIIGTFQKILTIDYTLVGICFPQQVVDYRSICEILGPVIEELVKEMMFYGYVQIDLLVDKSGIMLEGINWGLSQIGSSFFYFNYLSNSKQTEDGQYESEIIDPTHSTKTRENRYYVYSPFVLHFGLNQSQLKNFFQLCRAEGISFDLEKKYGSAFALLQGVKNAVGILATGRSTRISLGLIIQAVDFIYRQTCRNGMEDREARMRNRNNILAVKSRLQQCFNKGLYS